MARETGRIAKSEVVCPHCRHKQTESIHAKTTFCRSCGKHFEIVHEQPEAKRKGGSPTRWLLAAKRVLPSKGPREIRCFDCGTSQKVAPLAKSSICPKCSAYLDLKDFVIAGGFSRNVRTHGAIIIKAGGDFNSTNAYCSSAVIMGRLRGHMVCTGEMRVKATGRITGTIEAEKLVIDKHADVEFVSPLKVKDVEVAGKLSGRVVAGGTVRVRRKGCLRGNVQARGFKVDKGGEFHGSLTIGQLEGESGNKVDRAKNTRSTASAAKKPRHRVSGKHVPQES